MAKILRCPHCHTPLSCRVVVCGDRKDIMLYCVNPCPVPGMEETIDDTVDKSFERLEQMYRDRLKALSLA
jgi:hypothetical protein